MIKVGKKKDLFITRSKLDVSTNLLYLQHLHNSTTIEKLSQRAHKWPQLCISLFATSFNFEADCVKSASGKEGSTACSHAHMLHVHKTNYFKAQELHAHKTNYLKAQEFWWKIAHGWNKKHPQKFARNSKVKQHTENFTSLFYSYSIANKWNRVVGLLSPSFKASTTSTLNCH